MSVTPFVPHKTPMSATRALDDAERLINFLVNSEPLDTIEAAQNKARAVATRAKSILAATRAYLRNLEENGGNGAIMQSLRRDIRVLQDTIEPLKTELRDVRTNYRVVADLVNELEKALARENAVLLTKREAALASVRRYRRLARGKRPSIRKTARPPPTCPVCLNAPRSVVLFPCRHAALYEGCLSAMTENTPAGLKCPLCRVAVFKTEKVFF